MNKRTISIIFSILFIQLGCIADNYVSYSDIGELSNVFYINEEHNYVSIDTVNFSTDFDVFVINETDVPIQMRIINNSHFSNDISNINFPVFFPTTLQDNLGEFIFTLRPHERISAWNGFSTSVSFEFINGIYEYSLSLNSSDDLLLHINGVDKTNKGKLIDKHISYYKFKKYLDNEVVPYGEEKIIIEGRLKYDTNTRKIILTDNEDTFELEECYFKDYAITNPHLLQQYVETDNFCQLAFENTENGLKLLSIEGLRSPEESALLEKHINLIKKYDFFDNKYYERNNTIQPTPLEPLNAYHPCLVQNRPYDFDNNIYYKVESGKIMQYIEEGYVLYDFTTYWTKPTDATPIVLIEYDKTRKDEITVGRDYFLCTYEGVINYDNAQGLKTTIPKFKVIYPIKYN